MTVKPGDLAIVCNPLIPSHGRIVDVLSVAPAEPFVLPDGKLSEGSDGELCFACKGVGGMLPFIDLFGGTRLSRYLCYQATNLRPLPCDDVPEVERHTDEVTA
jgi:hypothetical protein